MMTKNNVINDNGFGHWDKITVDMMNKMFYNELRNELE